MTRYVAIVPKTLDAVEVRTRVSEIGTAVCAIPFGKIKDEATLCNALLSAKEAILEQKAEDARKQALAEEKAKAEKAEADEKSQD
jgi:hypothetical protein